MNTNLYDDFSETTEHFYDELGKLSECEAFFTKKEYKRLKNKIISLLFDSIETLFRKENITNKVERNELKKEHNAYKAENKSKSLITLIKEKIATKKLGQSVQTAQIEVVEPVGQLPPSQQDLTTQTESDVVNEGDITKIQEPEENSQDEQNGDA